MDNYRVYLTTRPLFSRFDREKGMPVIRKKNPRSMDATRGEFLNFSNLNKANESSIILMFHEDERLNTLWKHPLKYIDKFRRCMAVLTPDFTVQKGMDLPLVAFNVYKNRWLGCTYQQYGINVIPTVSWADSESYDVCFSGFERNAIVAVSTLGCKGDSERKDFVNGYNALLERKSPSLVICFGGLISGMKGKVLPVAYNEGFGFGTRRSFVPLFELPKVLDLKGDEMYGW